MVTQALVIGAGGFPQPEISEDDWAAGVVVLGPLQSVAGAVQDVARALADAGVGATAPILDPDRHELEDAWHKAQELEQPLIVHFSGHGVKGQGGLYLAVRKSDPSTQQALRASSVQVSQLLEDAEAASQPVLFLLDVCGAGKALSTQMAQHLVNTGGDAWPERQRRAWVIAACDANEITHGARFSQAMATVLGRLAKGLLDISPVLEYVPLETIAAEIDRELALEDLAADREGQSVVRTPHREAVLSEPPPFFRNPHYGSDPASRFLARTEGALRQFALESDSGLDVLHFASRAAGSRSDSVLFSGRKEQLRRIATWLDNTDAKQERLRVITGGPGSGKSALLGVSVCLTHPALRPLRQRIVARVENFRPQPLEHVVAVHARQMTIEQITASLQRQLIEQAGVTANCAPGVPSWQPTVAPGTDPDETGMALLVETLREAGPTALILDALDEAVDPAGVVHDLLMPLAGFAAEDADVPCRVLVGTRLWDDDALSELREALRNGPATLLDLDQERDDLAEDLARYLGDLLYGHHSQATAEGIARRLAEDAEHGAFLIAALYADHLLSQPAGDHHLRDEQVIDAVPCEITEMFDLHITALVTKNPWAGPVLQVLGQAQGQGMPLDLIHAAALAHAPQFRDRDLPPALRDTQAALTEALFYLRTTIDTDHRLLYRYFHQALSDHTRPACDPATLYQALMSTVPCTTDGAPRWDLATPYIQRHAAAHTVAVNPADIDVLLDDPLFLLYADPDHLSPYLHTAYQPVAIQRARTYRRSTAHHPQRHDPAIRRSLLALDAAAVRDTALAKKLAAAVIEHQPSPATFEWTATLSAASARLHTLNGHTGPVNAVATEVLPGLRGVAVTGGQDGKALIWELTTGRLLHTLSGHSGPVIHVDTVSQHMSGTGAALAVTAGPEDQPRIWDLQSGDLLHTLDGHAEGVRALATADLSRNRRNPRFPVVVTVDHTGQVRMWDLHRGRLLFSAGTSWAPCAIASVGVKIGQNEVTAFVLGGHAERAAVWIPELSRQKYRPLHTAINVNHAVAATALSEGRAVAVTAGSSSSALVWDVETGTLLRELPGHEGGVLTVETPGTIGENGQNATAITMDAKGKLRVWDLETGKRLRVLNPKAHAVPTAMAVGLEAIITGNTEGQLTVWGHGGWDPQRSRTSYTLGAHDGPVNAVAMGPYNAVAMGPYTDTVSCGEDGRVMVWSVGRQLAALPAHKGRVVTAAVTSLPHRPPIAVTADDHGEVMVRNLSNGQWPDLYGNARWQIDGLQSLTIVPLPNDQTGVVTNDDRGRLRLWDLHTGHPVRYLSRRGQCVAVAAAERTDAPPVAVTLDRHGRVLAWELAPALARSPQKVLTHVGATLLAAVRTPAGPTLLATAGNSPEILVSDLATSRPLHRLNGHSHTVTAMAALEHGSNPVILTGDESGMVVVSDPTAGRTLHSLHGHRNPVVAIATTIRPNGQPTAVTSDQAGSIRVWDLTAGKALGSPLHVPQAGIAVAAHRTGILLGYQGDLAYLRWQPDLL
ncbi:hypothetical protein ABZY05_47710 [Streptomyces canus]|uniref:hypothetical protein n=1 Tax=Streptomyces canus TaxID=58343 RepID=UPI0033A69126